jgi:cytochrome c oxidase subunit 2
VRRGSILQLVLIGVLAGAIATAVAVLVPWLPDPATKQADRINFAYWFTNTICLVIFAVVAAILIYAVINFRVKPGDLSDGPPVHGNTTLEVVWTVVPAVLVTAISIASAIVLAQNGHAGSNPLVVRVYAQQFNWQFKYPNGKVYPILRIPVDRNVKLRITANDVIHSFWVPEFYQKQDAVPGQWNDLIITPTRTGSFPVICTELCGLGHSTMRSEAIVMSSAAWKAWYVGSPAPGPKPAGGAGASVGATIFTQNGCGACHTFSPIPDATGKVGPSLDNLKESAEKAGQDLEAFIKQSIVDPNAYVPTGYQPGVMPPTFGSTIPATQLNALVLYLAQNTN